MDFIRRISMTRWPWRRHAAGRVDLPRGGDPLDSSFRRRSRGFEPRGCLGGGPVASRGQGRKVPRVVYAGSSSVCDNTPILPKCEDVRPSPISLRCREAGWLTLCAVLHPGIWAGSSNHPLLQRLRTVIGSHFPILRSSGSINPEDAGG